MFGRHFVAVGVDLGEGSFELLDPEEVPFFTLAARLPRMEFGRPRRGQWLEDRFEAAPFAQMSLNPARERRLRRWVVEVLDVR